MKKKVIVIDDDFDLAAIISKKLKALEFEVSHFADGETYLNSADFNSPALYIVDVTLPGTDGIEVIRKIRKLNSLLPIIIVSIKANQADIINGLKSGADDYITKPFDFGELLTRIQVYWQKFQILMNTR